MMTPGLLSLRARVSILVAIAITGVLCIAAWAIDFRVDDELENRFDKALAARVEALAAMTHREANGIEFEAADATQLVQDPGVTSWYALACEGNMISASPADAAALLPSAASTTGTPRMRDVQPAGLGLARQATLSFRPEPDEGWRSGMPAPQAE
ncbi:MAG: hypothetical protein WBW61_04060, partial [Rhodanobacteraceae bacterium]